MKTNQPVTSPNLTLTQTLEQERDRLKRMLEHQNEQLKGVRRLVDTTIQHNQDTLNSI